MTKTYTITNVTEENIFTIEIAREGKSTLTEELNAADLIEAVKSMKSKINVVNDEFLIHMLNELAYIEIADEEGEFDVYLHKFSADEDGLEYNAAGEYLKTYKSEKAARNFAAKQGHPIF